MLSFFRRAALLLLALVCLGGLTYLLGAVWVTAPADDQADRPHRIYVLSNGFHSDIALPVEEHAALGVALEDFPVIQEDIRYLAIGWGSLTAYTSLLDVSDLTLGIVAKAAAFDESVVHIQPLGPLTAGGRVYAFDLTGQQMDRLLARLRADFASTAPIPNLTQGFGGRFYDGNGRFSAWRTCNTWTGEHLRAIGLGVGFWTPSAWSLEYGLKRASHSM